MNIKKALILIFLSFSILTLSAQFNSDSVFTVAINQAQNKEYTKAIVNSQKAFEADKNRADILVFISNIYSWQEMNDSALLYIQKAKNLEYKNDDLYDSWTNILLRSHKYNDLLIVCNEAEQNNYSNTDNLLQKRMLACLALEDYDKGIALARAVNEDVLINNEANNNLYTTLLLKRNTNLISANYALDLFDSGYAPQHLGSFGYSFNLNGNNLGFRMNYANRFDKNDVQLESDYYRQLGNKHYMYFNYGYAFNGTLFPRHRAGLEYYFPIPGKMEGSIGGRLLNYTNNNVYIITGHLGKYIGKSWMAVRPFYVLQPNKQSLTIITNYRHYGKNELYYWGVELGFGNSPDDIFSTTGGFNELNAYKIKFERNFMINRVSDIHFGLGYSYEEIPINQYRNRLTIEVGYKFRLK